MYNAIHSTGDKSWGYVIEGYPRTQQQAQDFETTVQLVYWWAMFLFLVPIVYVPEIY